MGTFIERHFPVIFLIGLIAGLIYWYTRPIVSLFGAHGMANALPSNSERG